MDACSLNKSEHCKLSRMSNYPHIYTTSTSSYLSGVNFSIPETESNYIGFVVISVIKLVMRIMKKSHMLSISLHWVIYVSFSMINVYYMHVT